MDEVAEIDSSKSYWIVAATKLDLIEQINRFVEGGYWEPDGSVSRLAHVEQMQEGDQIAIRTLANQKRDIPFENHGHSVSVMAIHAVGTITKASNGSGKLGVDWQVVNPPRNWYFYTHIKKIWKIAPHKWYSAALIDFVFYGGNQDIERFRNEPYWSARFGDEGGSLTEMYEWIQFYEDFATNLLSYKDRRDELVAGIHEIGTRIDGLSLLNDRDGDGSQFLLTDICPFTVMGLFNRGLSEEIRTQIAQELGNLIGVKLPAPTTFEGIPKLNNQRSWFFGSSTIRATDDIDSLWELFASAIELADAPGVVAINNFSDSYSKVIEQNGTGWNLTMGCYWIRPRYFVTLDSLSRTFLDQALDIPVVSQRSHSYLTASEYLDLRSNLENRFDIDNFPVHSFPQLSEAAWLWNGLQVTSKQSSTEANIRVFEADFEGDNPLYSKSKFLTDVFMEEARYERLRELVLRKKNVILQGAPGVGKTFAAKRLAFSILGERDASRIQMVQFHQSYSYEDFVMGYRPNSTGGFILEEGPFFKFCKQANQDLSKPYFFIIDEINRGNLSKIFGELLMLIESDKRGDENAIKLQYKDEQFSVPENVHLIGMMNTADRGLAMIDYALRRRFAFFDMEPAFQTEGFKIFQGWINDPRFDELVSKIGELNDDICNDPMLGAGFRIGHSYLCLTENPTGEISDVLASVVEYELIPLLDEYWFDEPTKVENWADQLRSVLRD